MGAVLEGRSSVVGGMLWMLGLSFLGTLLLGGGRRGGDGEDGGYEQNAEEERTHGGLPSPARRAHTEPARGGARAMRPTAGGTARPVIKGCQWGRLYVGRRRRRYQRAGKRAGAASRISS